MDPERIKVYVKPNSGKNSVEGIFNGRIKIKICSPPQDGRANKELIDFISEKGVFQKKMFVLYPVKDPAIKKSK